MQFSLVTLENALRCHGLRPGQSFRNQAQIPNVWINWASHCLVMWWQPISKLIYTNAGNAILALALNGNSQCCIFYFTFGICGLICHSSQPPQLYSLYRFKDRRSLRCLKLIASIKYSCNLVTFLLIKHVKQRLYLSLNVTKSKKRHPVYPMPIHCWDKQDNLNSPNLNVFASNMRERQWRGTYSISICLKEENIELLLTSSFNRWEICWWPATIFASPCYFPSRFAPIFK